MKFSHSVLVFPAWRDNPYLNLMSLSARSAGFTFLGATRWDSLREQLKRLQPGDIFHLHWTSPLLQEADDEAEADARLTELRQVLSSLDSRGVRLLWTVHNKLPHELKYRAQEIELHGLLAHYATAIHIMNPSTPAVLEGVCELDPAKVRVIAHPSYQGVYSADPPRTSARREFGIADNELAVLFLGQIRPYKGVDNLIEAVARAASEGRPVVLLLAGLPKEVTAAELVAMIPDYVKVVLHLDFVDDADIARWFVAADVAVFPYRAILNSGSVHLAATYGTPVVLPDEAHLRTMFEGQTWVEFFDPNDVVASISRRLTTRDHFNAARVQAKEFGAEISPWQISNEYRALLEELSAPLA